MFDTQPPTLAVAADPSGLWPPKGNLVPINVVVTLGDECDRHSTVRLDSITCDDGCNSAADIDGASFGSDDREFRLRSTRTGGGPGRTYTITYIARAAAQNQTTATTTVRVPHDREH